MHNKYISDTQNSLKSNHKKCCQLLKSKCSKSFPALMIYENQFMIGGKKIVHSFPQ